MSEFTYLFRGREVNASAEQMQKTMEKWVAWFKDLGAKGHIKDPGHPLEHAGKVVSGKKKVVTDGPFAEAKDVVGGYIIVEAKDLAHAAELAKDCPILQVGGSVEVRPVQKLTCRWRPRTIFSGVRRGAWSPCSRGSSESTTWRWQKTSYRTPSAARWKCGASAACRKIPPPG